MSEEASLASDHPARSMKRAWLTNTIPKLRTIASEAVKFYFGDRIQSEEFESQEFVKHQLGIKDCWGP